MQSRRLALNKSSKQCMLEQWNPMNLLDSEQNLCSPKFMNVALPGGEGGLLLWRVIILVRNFIPMPEALKDPGAEAAVGDEWGKVETFPAWEFGMVKSKKEVILEAQRDKKKAHFATLMDICHLKMRS